MTAREKIIVANVQQAIDKYGITGIKVEFEAVFNRNRVTNDCEYCDGTGTEPCTDCDGEGHWHDDDDNEVECGTCHAMGSFDCIECDGAVEGNSAGTNWSDMALINDRILARLAPLGLAKRLPQGTHSDYAHEYMPKKPLVFSKVYNDSTVDTEQTVTLLLDKAKNILLLPKLLEAYTALKEDIGQGIEVDTAGMHMAWLFSEDARYPAHPPEQEMVKFKNFRKSMILLMPALFFLGSHNEKSRRLGYRMPRIGCQDMNYGDHAAAINYTHGALEFRVFDTCYDNPQAILDNVMVMCNCMRYWTKKYTRNYLAQVANNVDFGHDNGDTLKRLYVTSEHIDLLNRGLRLIKPCYYTIGELKLQRNFGVTKHQTKNYLKEARIKAELQYKEYEKRIGWEIVMRKNSYIANSIQSLIVDSRDNIIAPPEDAEVMAQIEAEAKDMARLRSGSKMPQEDYIKENMGRIAQIGEYKLCVE